MMIQSVEIEYFRGIYKAKKFDFEKKKFVLISAENGMGKTTVLDAIEWCLTGNIGRLRTAYDSRSTNNEERKENLGGILKNSRAKVEDKVRVTLWMEYEGTDYVITRTQKADELNPEKGEIVIEDEKGNRMPVSLLDQICGKNFYNYHFCDMQKSFNIQNTQRGKLSDLFDDFISDYQREENVAENLKLFKDDADRKIKDNERTLEILDNNIVTKTQQQQNLTGNSNFPDYNQTPMFEGEHLDLSKLSVDQMTEQIENLYNCGYSQAYEKLGMLIADNENRKIHTLLTGLIPVLAENREKVQEAVALKLYEADNLLTQTQEKFDKYKDRRMTNENYTELAGEVIAMGNSRFDESFYTQAQNEIKSFRDQIRALEDEISVLTNGNGIMKTLSDLVKGKQDIIRLKNELKTQKKPVKCPVCGSEQFGVIPDSAVLEEAGKYIQESSKIIADKNELCSELAQKQKATVQQIIEAGNIVLQQENSRNQIKLERLENLKKSTISFFETAAELNKLSPETFSNEKLQDMDWVVSEQAEYQAGIKTDSFLKDVRDEISNILYVVGYDRNDGETEKATKLRIEKPAKSAPCIREFNIIAWIEKINAIRSVKSNAEYRRIDGELQQLNSQKITLEKANDGLRQLGEKANRRAEDIISTVEVLKKAEYDNVGPYLFRFYKKLARVNTIQKIVVSFDDDKISLRDEKGKNIVNVLSNGQLSIFMLSFFFGGIVSRSSTEKCRVYFIDDLTSCMDDINMLNFLDTLKYQLTSEQLMEQVFFSSCDNKICELIKYKLDGCDIKYKELKEENF